MAEPQTVTVDLGKIYAPGNAVCRTVVLERAWALSYVRALWPSIGTEAALRLASWMVAESKGGASS